MQVNYSPIPTNNSRVLYEKESGESYLKKIQSANPPKEGFNLEHFKGFMDFCRVCVEIPYSGGFPGQAESTLNGALSASRFVLEHNISDLSFKVTLKDMCEIAPRVLKKSLGLDVSAAVQNDAFVITLCTGQNSGENLVSPDY